MEYACSICQYSSLKKQHVVSHINKKKTCGPGLREVIEIPIEMKCKYCDKDFSCLTSLNYHVKHTCKNKDDAKDEEIRKLKEENKQLKQVTINNSVNSVNNINIFIVNNYENTSLEKLTDKDYNKIINSSEEPYQIIPNFIKYVHFNDKIPENNNICISNRNKNNKFIGIVRNGHLEVVDKATEIDNLINDKETNISDWIIEKGSKFPVAVEKFNEYTDTKHEDDNLKLIKNEVELILYNNKHMVKTKP